MVVSLAPSPTIRHRFQMTSCDSSKVPGPTSIGAADGCLTQRVADRRTGPNLTVARVGASVATSRVATGGAVSSGKTFTFAVTGEAVPFRFVAFWGPLALAPPVVDGVDRRHRESFSTPAVAVTGQVVEMNHHGGRRCERAR